MLTCEAHGCFSNENTKVDGKDILLFPFPTDVTRRSDWLRNCQLSENSVTNKPLYLCELHFDKESFTNSKQLIPNAIPSIFDSANSQKQHKIENEPDIESITTSPLKQSKLDNDTHSILRQSQSSCTQFVRNLGKMNGDSKMDICSDQEILNVPARTKPKLDKERTEGEKVFRLIIQIDKIHGKPCPKSKKIKILMRMREKLLYENMNASKMNQSLQRINEKTICVTEGCKLKKSIYNSKPAFQCEHCDKYYIWKKTNIQEEKNIYTTSHKAFPFSQSLHLHNKTQFMCDMCQTECTTQITYDKHIRLHVSTDPLHPYKCHQCPETFELKEDVRQHLLIVHPTIKLQNTILQMSASSSMQQPSQQQNYRCSSCNITFRDEQAYRNHTNSHTQKEGFRCSIGDSGNKIFPVPSPITGSQIGILRAVKFSCRVCSMEFDNVGEVDKHTKTHIKHSEEDRKCNICKKSFVTSAQLNEHLKYHLTRAHSCPVCPKAFINRTTLRIHLKTHSKT